MSVEPSRRATRKRKAASPTASVLLLKAQVAGARLLGIDDDELARATGAEPQVFSAESLSDPDARVPASLLLALWQYLPTRFADESFGLWLAEKLDAPPLGLASWLISTSPTLGEGFARALRYQRLLHDEAQSALELTEREAVYRHQIGAPPFRAPAPAIEFGFVAFLQLAARMTGARLLPKRVRLKHAAPRDPARHYAWFGPQLEFSAREDELVLARDDLERKALVTDATLSRIVQAHADAALARLPTTCDLRARVRAQIRELLADGTPTMATLCARLGLSRRTLQRHLEALGTSFAAELDDTRRELALDYLADARVSVQDTAFSLGFSDVTAFCRAFQRWTGQTPHKFRRRAG
jgi:AraC-like DNA-binding protein